jgi:hypothetical protein
MIIYAPPFVSDLRTAGWISFEKRACIYVSHLAFCSAAASEPVSIQIDVLATWKYVVTTLASDNAQ